MIHNDFPEMNFRYIDVEQSPELAAEFSVFTIPTLIVFFEGKEYFRKSRVFGIQELSDAISRPYNLLFS